MEKDQIKKELLKNIDFITYELLKNNDILIKLKKDNIKIVKLEYKQINKTG